LPKLASAISSASELLDYPSESTVDGCKAFFRICRQLRISAKAPKNINLELSELEPEYIRLFSADYGGVTAPPYASFYTEKRIWGKAAVDVINFYYDCGYRFDHDNVKEPPDNVVFELAFLSMLIENGRTDSAAVMIVNHLNWLGEFEKSVKKNARLEFYPSVLAASIKAIKLIKEELC